MLASINGTDITAYIQETSYKVNQVDVTDELYDGNYKLHKFLLRKRINGSFQIVFVRHTDLENFLNLVKNNTTGNLLRITLWVSNINKAVETDVYFTIESKKKRKISNNYDFMLFDVDIEEA